MVSIAHIIHFIYKLCIINSSPLVLFQKLYKFLNRRLVNSGQNLFKRISHFENPQSTVKFRVIFMESCSKGVIVPLVFKLFVNCLENSVSEVNGLVFISDEVLKHHDDVNSVLIVLHFFGKPFKLVVCQGWVEGSKTSVEGWQIDGVVPDSQIHFMKEVV